MATYLLVDTMNTFFRARHVVRGDAETKIGMAIHITLNAINKCYRKLCSTPLLYYIYIQKRQVRNILKVPTHTNFLQVN